MEILLQGFVLGLIGGIVPGSILTLLFVSVLRRGFKGGLFAFWWVMLAEVFVAGLLLFMATRFNFDASFFSLVGLVGSVVLGYLAWQVKNIRWVDVSLQKAVIFTPQKIFLLTATNVPLYIFWSTVCFPLIWQLAETWTWGLAAPSFFFFFELGWGLATLAMMFVFVFARPWLSNPKIAHNVFLFLALILFLLGLKMFLQSLCFFEYFCLVI